MVPGAYFFEPASRNLTSPFRSDHAVIRALSDDCFPSVAFRFGNWKAKIFQKVKPG